jgi:hypothetical protein
MQMVADNMRTKPGLPSPLLASPEAKDDHGGKTHPDLLIDDHVVMRVGLRLADDQRHPDRHLLHGQRERAIGGSTDPNTPYNCVVTGSGCSTGLGDLSAQTAAINLKNGDTVTYTFENTGNGATRTQASGRRTQDSPASPGSAAQRSDTPSLVLPSTPPETAASSRQARRPTASTPAR